MHAASTRYRQRKREFGTYSLSADNIYIFFVGCDYLFDDGQPQSGSFFIFTSRRILLVKAFPDTLYVFPADAFAMVLDPDKRFRSFLFRLDLDHRLRLRELDRVVYQVVEDLLDPAEVRIDERALRCK